MLRPAVTLRRNGTTSSGFSGPPKETSRSASYGWGSDMFPSLGRPRVRPDARHLSPGVLAPRRLRVLGHRTGRAVADLDDDAGHRAAGQLAERVLRARRAGVGGV